MQMDRTMMENGSIQFERETLSEPAITEHRSATQPSGILPENLQRKIGQEILSPIHAGARALCWTSDRLAGWKLPSKKTCESASPAYVSAELAASDLYSCPGSHPRFSHWYPKIGQDATGRPQIAILKGSSSMGSVGAQSYQRCGRSWTALPRVRVTGWMLE